MSWFSSKKLLVLFFLALTVRLGFFAVSAYQRGTVEPEVGGGDAAAYLQLGKNVLLGRGFSESIVAPFTPVAGRMPVVPLLLGLFGDHRLTYVILQMVVAAAAVVIVYRIGELWFSTAIATGAAVLFAFDPLSAAYSQQFLSETYFTFFFLLSVYYFSLFWVGQAYPDAAWAGLFLGLATLTRPVGAVFLAVMSAFILLCMHQSWRSRVAAVVVFSLIFTAAVSPWLIRNRLVFGVWGLSSLPAYNLYWYNARQFYAWQNHVSNEKAKAQFRVWAADTAGKPEYDNELKLQKFYLAKAGEIIKQNVNGYIGLQFINAAAVYINTGYDEVARVSDGDYGRGSAGVREFFVEHPALFFIKLALLLIYGVIGLGVFLNFGIRYWRWRFLFLIVTIAVFGLTTGAVAEPRFRVPAEPFVILAFVQALSILISKRPRPEAIPSSAPTIDPHQRSSAIGEARQPRGEPSPA